MLFRSGRDGRASLEKVTRERRLATGHGQVIRVLAGSQRGISREIHYRLSEGLFHTLARLVPHLGIHRRPDHACGVCAGEA